MFMVSGLPETVTPRRVEMISWRNLEMTNKADGKVIETDQIGK